ncbi:MAG: Acyl-CoA thioesterase-like protein [Myxococcaceae bacterium]|nr:Acyl-CoA thioesterase-like protein [Myxococcaceae bacterium]
MSYQIGNLYEDTAVSADPSRPGRYLANISPNWNILYVFGGLTMATAISAARASLTQPHFDLLSATATYLSPIQAGPITLDVRKLRVGKGSEQIAVDMRHGQPDDAREGISDLHTVCTFGPKRATDTTFTDLTFPEVPTPDSLARPKPPAGFGVARLAYNYSVETRPVLGNLPWDKDWQAGPARWMAWHRLRNSPRLPDGTLDPLAYVPAADMIGPAVRQAQGPHSALAMVISLEISLHVYGHTHGEWLLQDSQACQANDGYVSGRVNLWDEQGKLVAQASQRAMLKPLVR